MLLRMVLPPGSAGGLDATLRGYALAMVTTAARRSWALVLTLGCLLALTMVSAPSAYACSCVGYDFEEAAEAADLIADVTVGPEIANDQGDATYFTVVDTVWKGEESRSIELRTHEQTTACGLGPIEDGTSLLVWAYGGAGQYSTTWCALPMDGGPDTREQLTELLGEPADLTGEPAPEAPSTFPTTLVVIIVGTVVVALAIGSLILVALAVLLVLRLRQQR